MKNQEIGNKAEEQNQTDSEQRTPNSPLTETRENTPPAANEIPFIITNFENMNEEEIRTILNRSEEQQDDNITMQNKDYNSNKAQTEEKESQTNDISSTETHISQPKKSKKKLMFGIFGLLAILLTLSSFTWIYYQDKENAEKQEVLDLAVLCEENYNQEDYSLFLKKYPQSKHYRNVEQRLTELKMMAADWKLIEQSKNENKFVDFKNKYKDSYYSRLCNLKIDSIDWNVAKEENTPDAYQKYLSRHPNGVYMSDAIIAKSEVSYMTISEEEINNINNVCSHFFNALGVNNTTEISNCLAPKITLFMDIENPSLEDVFNWAYKNQENYSFVNYYIHEGTKISREVNEFNEIYFSLIMKLDKITTNDMGEESTEPFESNLLMNRNFQIYSLTLKKL